MNNKPQIKFGAKIAALRGDIPQKAISDKLGYSSAQFISNIERGVAPMPLSMVRPLARVLGIQAKLVYKHWVMCQVEIYDQLYKRYGDRRHKPGVLLYKRVRVSNVSPE